MNSTKILQTQLNEARNQYKQSLAALKAAADAAETDTNDVGKRTTLVEAEAEAEAAEDAYNRIRQQRSSIKSAQVDTDPPATRSEVEDWERRHDLAYHLLVMSLSEQYQGMTINCPDLSSLWKALEKHFEGKSAADMIHAESQLMSLALTDKDDPEEFLSNIRLVQTQMESCGAAYTDARMFLTVAQKLPPRMHGLRDQLLYGPKERQTFSCLEQAIIEFAKNNPTKREPEKANLAEKKEKKPKCKHCKIRGHKKEDCRSRTHKCTKCGETGHFEKRCKGDKPSTEPSTSKESTHYAFSATTRQWVVDTGASSSISSHVDDAEHMNGEYLTLAD